MMRRLEDVCEAERHRSVSMLALGPKTARLQQGGFTVLGDVLDDAANDFRRLRLLPAFGRRSVLQVQERIGGVLSCTGASGEVDWHAFSRLCGLAPTTGTTPSGPLADADRAVPAGRLHLGARTGRLVAGGLTTAGRLVDDRAEGFTRVRQAPRLGEAAVGLVERRLRTLDACRTADGAVDWVMFDAVCSGQVVRTSQMAAPSPPPPPDPGLPPFSATAKARPVEVLRLGPKAKFLRQAAISTIGHLERDSVQERLPRLAGLGQGTVEIIRNRLADLAASVDETGEPQWDSVAASWGFPVMPDHPLPTGEVFLEAAADVIARWIGAHDSEADRLILSERLVRSREDRMKLDDLGRRLGVTRERVRQREKKLLDGLCDALLADDQSRSPVQFSAEFRAWWALARSAYADATTLTWPSFVSGLERAWSVPASRLTTILPLALAVLTDGGQVVPPRSPIPPRLLEPLAPSLLRTNIRGFPVGRALNDLEDAGCTSFGALLLAATENRLPQGRSGEVGSRILTAVANAVSPGGELDAPRLAAALEMPLLPEQAPRTASEFLSIFDSCVETAIGFGRATGRASDIWRIRTRQPSDKRPTLEKTAALLGTSGPNVKREETVLLASLNAQLVQEELVNAGVVWRREFLDRVAEAAAMHKQAGGDYAAFTVGLASQWDLNERKVYEGAAGLWAVLSLYPNGWRRVGRSRPNAVAPLAQAPQVESSGLIVLRGFRRAH